MLHSLPYLLLENFQSCRPASFGDAMPIYQYTLDDRIGSGRFDFIGTPGKPVLYHSANFGRELFVGYDERTEMDGDEAESLLASYTSADKPSNMECPGAYQLRQVRMYLREGGNPNARGWHPPRYVDVHTCERSGTLLDTAISHNQARIVFLLIRHGCDVNLRDEPGRSAYDILGRPDYPWEWPSHAFIRLLLWCAGAKSMPRNRSRP